MVLFDDDGNVAIRNPCDIAKGAAVERRGRDVSCAAVDGLEGKELAWLYDLREIDEGRIVLEPIGIGGIGNQAVAATHANFFAIIFKDEGFERIGSFAGVFDGGYEHLSKDQVVVRRPAEGIDDVAELLVAPKKFFTLQDATGFAAGLLNPDIVMLEFVLFGFDGLIDGVNDAAIGGVGKGGDIFVDGLQRFVDVLSTSGRE